MYRLIRLTSRSGTNRKIGRTRSAKKQKKMQVISQNVVNLIKETQISRMMLPKKYGGPQADLKTFAKVVRKVANYNISAAWLTYLYPLHNMLPAFLPEKGSRRNRSSRRINLRYLCCIRKSRTGWRWLSHQR